MFDVYKIKEVCKDCRHPRFCHVQDISWCRFFFCKCRGFENIDNLTYVEYVAAQKWWKRVISAIGRLPLRTYTWYRGMDDFGDFILLKCILFPAGGFAILAVIGLAVLGISESAKESEAVKHCKINCYSGARLLYSGRVVDLTDNDHGSVEIKTQDGHEYLCNGLEKIPINEK